MYKHYNFDEHSKHIHLLVKKEIKNDDSIDSTYFKEGHTSFDCLSQAGLMPQLIDVDSVIENMCPYLDDEDKLHSWVQGWKYAVCEFALKNIN